jgi:hypothetical protein
MGSREQNPQNMKHTKLVRFVESLIILPMATMSSVPALPTAQATLNIVTAPHTVLIEKLNIDDSVDANALEQKAKAEAIDSYFANNGVPLKGTGLTMVLAAEKNDLDWRLVPAIAMRESTGGKHACKSVTYNPFGWASCKVGFKSYNEAIETIARNLGGNNPKTAHHYDNKTTIQILHAYNPPSIVPKYAEQVLSIMNTIGKEDLGKDAGVALNSGNI